MAVDMPDVLVRNTFLELVPEQLPVRRAQTTPAGACGTERGGCGDGPPTPLGVTPLSEQSTAGDEDFHSPRDPMHVQPPFLSRLRTGDSLHAEEAFHSPREGCAPWDARECPPWAPPAWAPGEACGEPAPAQLPLEQLVTDDRFEEPSALPAAWAVPGPGPAAPAPAPWPACQAPWPPPPPPAPPAVELLALALPEVPQGSASLASICQPNRLTCAGGLRPGWSRVQWAVDARKLEGKDKQAVSPEFVIDLPSHGPASFRMNLYPRHTNDGRGGGGFKKAKGRGRVELKCEAQLSADVPGVVFHVGVGIGGKQQPLRGPVSVNFLDHPCGGLPKGEEEWDFGAAVDETRTFLVFLEIAPPATVAAVV